jgi:flagellar hook-length control protein FliK
MLKGHVTGHKRERTGSSAWYAPHAEANIRRIEAAERRLHMARTSKTSTGTVETTATANCAQCGAATPKKSLRKGTCRKCYRSNLAQIHDEQVEARWNGTVHDTNEAPEPAMTAGEDAAYAAELEAELDAEYPQESADATVEPEAQAPTKAKATKRAAKRTTKAKAVAAAEPEQPASVDMTAFLGVTPDAAKAVLDVATVEHAPKVETAEDDGLWLVATWTTADLALDSGHTTTMDGDAGMYQGKTVRKVETPMKYAYMQRSRYQRVLALAATESEWKELVGSGKAVLTSQETSTSRASSSNEVTTKVDPAHTPGESARVRFILDLAAQGVQAIQDALDKGILSVRMAGAPKVAKPTPATPSTSRKVGSPIRAKLNLDIARDIRRCIAEAKASGAGKGIEQRIAAELGVHPTTIADRRRA